MKRLEIGSVLVDSMKKEMMVHLHDGYHQALNKLDLFSHCMLFFLLEDRIEVCITHISQMNESKGELILTLPHNQVQAHGQEKPVGPAMWEAGFYGGQLIDIKAYFPAEEVILEASEPAHRLCLHDGNRIIGGYEMRGKRSIIQLNKKMLDDITLNSNAIQMIRKGEYMRVLWWCHRFDKDLFRKIRMCNPPYHNAPRTGIFATRSPVRPNPIGSTIVLVDQVDYVRGVIDVTGFDGFPGTKIFQIMFYQPSLDKIEGAALPPWEFHWTMYKSFEQPKEIDTAPKISSLATTLDVGNIGFFDALEADDSIDNDYDHQEIHIHNAHIHNLKHISVTLPKNSTNLITGVSGSGKSSLAFDTIYAESQKQFTDLVLSNQLLHDTFSKVYVDKITGLQPAIAIEQRTSVANPRSTVGTVTKTADMLKLIFATIGERVCPTCHDVISDSNVCRSCGEILFDPTPQLFSYNHPDYMCPVCKGMGLEMCLDVDKIVECPEKSLLDCASSFYGDLRKHQKKPNANWMRGEILALATDFQVDLELPFSELPEAFKQQFFYGSNGREVSLTYENSKGRSGIITRPVEGAVHLIQRLTHDTNSAKMIEQAQKYMSHKKCTRCLMKLLGKPIETMGPLESARGLESFKDVCYVNQKPIGSNSRSNPGTYTGVFDLIRKCYADTEEAKSKALSKEYFSFNTSKGQCAECRGLGEVSVNMHYMDDLYVPCHKCHGKRYSNEVLYIKRKGLSIGDILDLEVQDSLTVFEEEAEIAKKLSLLDQVGLGYLKLGQSASTLSGGEAQRIKLAKELDKTECQHILYILDEPTTGLHDEDVEKVTAVLMALKEKGATIIVIEHNIKLIKACDYIVELGPRGGNQGGYITKAGYQRLH